MTLALTIREAVLNRRVLESEFNIGLEVACAITGIIVLAVKKQAVKRALMA